MIPPGLGIAGIAAATILIPLAVNYHDNGIRREYAAEVRAQLAEQALEHQAQMQEQADKFKSQHEEEIKGYQEKDAANAARIREMERTIETQLDSDPISVDASIAREFYLGLCKIKAGRDNDARKTCDLRAAQADLARYSPVLSVTSATIDNWQYLCDETGSDDYCKPRVIGFKPAAVVQLIGWLNMVDTARMTDEANYDIIVDQINEILATPGPTVEK